jgi:hypothetical protein
MSDITLTRLPGYDVNGNPRYVCHYVNLLTEQELKQDNRYIPEQNMTLHYAIAVHRSHKIGGKKYHNKRYGGGIVFQGYESVIRADIKRIMAEAEQAEK